MMDWTKLLHLGDLSLTVPLAAAMAAWLLAAGEWRTALRCSLLFAAGLGLVGATKIAFIAWGGGIPALGFKAISGHATAATAVFPVLFYLLLYRQGALLRAAAGAAGFGLGALVAVLLVAADEHSAAEALAGWTLGALLALVAIELAAGSPAPPALQGMASAATVLIGTTWLMRSAPIGWWMIKAALVLSGSHRPFSFHG